MRASNILPCLAILGDMPSSSSGMHRPPPHPAFVNPKLFSLDAHRKSFERNQILDPDLDTTEALLEAEEAAAIDAHDVSDPGVEGAAMERAVIMAAELNREMPHPHHNKEDLGFFGRIKSLLHHDTSEETSMAEVSDAEANYAHDLSDAAAMEHANQVGLEGEGSGERDEEEDVLRAEATYAQSLSDVAAAEHVKMFAEEEEEEEEEEEDRLKAEDSEAAYAQSLSDISAVEHARLVNEADDEAAVHFRKKEGISAMDRILSVEEHYESMDKDIKAIERLIEEADRADRSEGHSLERTFSDDDAADLALMMMEKSVEAAADKLELCQEKARTTEREATVALEQKYAAKALAESIERDRRAAEMRFLSTEHYDDDAEVLERKRDASILHADGELLSDALKQERDAELQLERAIEDDIEAKKELEHMIDNKATLRQELHHLEEIIHERTVALWEKENAAKAKANAGKEEKKEEHHHFDWWHKRW